MKKRLYVRFFFLICLINTISKTFLMPFHKKKKKKKEKKKKTFLVGCKEKYSNNFSIIFSLSFFNILFL